MRNNATKNSNIWTNEYITWTEMCTIYKACAGIKSRGFLGRAVHRASPCLLLSPQGSKYKWRQKLAPVRNSAFPAQTGYVLGYKFNAQRVLFQSHSLPTIPSFAWRNEKNTKYLSQDIPKPGRDTNRIHPHAQYQMFWATSHTRQTLSETCHFSFE